MDRSHHFPGTASPDVFLPRTLISLARQGWNLPGVAWNPLYRAGLYGTEYILAHIRLV